MLNIREIPLALKVLKEVAKECDAQVKEHQNNSLTERWAENQKSVNNTIRLLENKYKRFESIINQDSSMDPIDYMVDDQVGNI